jgi:hypothetical protein
MYYYWEGKFPREKGIPLYFGVGELEFDETESGINLNTKGWYSETPSAEEKTIKRSAVYYRASKEEVTITRGADLAKLKVLITTLINQRKRLIEQ